MPIYNMFVEQAKALDPTLLVMVIPVAMVLWWKGARRVSEVDARRQTNSETCRLSRSSYEAFRASMLRGGVCYFLWDRDNDGDCE